MPNGCDNCPDDYDPLQSDADFDGVGDVCDICPANALDVCDPNGSVAVEVDPNEGGTIETPDGVLRIDIDPNDLFDFTTISVTEIFTPDPDVDLMIGSNPGWGEAVAVYDLEPDGLVFNNPVTITITADVTELNQKQRDRLGVYLWDEAANKFILLDNAECDVVEDPPGTFIKTCTVELEHFSTYAMVLSLDWASLVNGDFTGEGRIDLDDLGIISRAWGLTDSIADIYPQPDGDSLVNVSDLHIMALHWLDDISP